MYFRGSFGFYGVSLIAQRRRGIADVKLFMVCCAGGVLSEPYVLSLTNIYVLMCYTLQFKLKQMDMIRKIVRFHIFNLKNKNSLYLIAYMSSYYITLTDLSDQ